MVQETPPAAEPQPGRLAAAEDHDAGLALARRYERGTAPGDAARAAELYEAAAAAGNPVAMRDLGDLYVEGEGVPRDPQRALYLYRAAAAQGELAARYRAAELVLDMPEAGDAARRAAASEIEAAARGGYVQAQIGLGEMLLEGTWRRRDPLEAARWFAVALEPLRAEAAAGDGSAQQRLGDLYRDGKGVPEDGREAARWYLRALESGRSSAVMRLARLYERGGLGLPPDEAEAARWLARAAGRGNAVAAYDLARRHLRGTGVPQDRNAALGLFETAAEGGEPRAFRYLGELLSDPAMPGADPRAAVMWLERAAREGDGKAMFQLAELYEKSPLVAVDHERALIWYSLAARHGYERGAERVNRVAARLDGRARARAADQIAAFEATRPDR
ncbi:tetratricopeptide repeat protein [Geminicoccaceae bacterium 1502E]|nr:tetratricopeptide repeat protein [Geminicoccaceae bacterium 1502E]